VDALAHLAAKAKVEQDAIAAKEAARVAKMRAVEARHETAHRQAELSKLAGEPIHRRLLLAKPEADHRKWWSAPNQAKPHDTWEVKKWAPLEKERLAALAAGRPWPPPDPVLALLEAGAKVINGEVVVGEEEGAACAGENNTTEVLHLHATAAAPLARHARGGAEVVVVVAGRDAAAASASAASAATLRGAGGAGGALGSPNVHLKAGVTVVTGGLGHATGGSGSGAAAGAAHGLRGHGATHAERGHDGRSAAAAASLGATASGHGPHSGGGGGSGSGSGGGGGSGGSGGAPRTRTDNPITLSSASNALTDEGAAVAAEAAAAHAAAPEPPHHHSYIAVARHLDQHIHEADIEAHEVAQAAAAAEAAALEEWRGRQHHGEPRGLGAPPPQPLPQRTREEASPTE
jgi:hypothetical protein